MGDEEPQCKVEYLDTPDGSPEETNWIKRAGKCKVTYPNTHTFEGTYDAERIRQGHGVYIWNGPTSEEDETPVEKARFEGNYKDGQKSGFGRMVYPNGDIYEGEWLANKVNEFIGVVSYFFPDINKCFFRCMVKVHIYTKRQETSIVGLGLMG